MTERISAINAAIQYLIEAQNEVRKLGKRSLVGEQVLDNILIQVDRLVAERERLERK